MRTATTLSSPDARLSAAQRRPRPWPLLLAASLLLPAPALAGRISAGDVSVGIGLGVGSAGVSARVKVGYVVHHLFVPFVSAEGQLSTPLVATAAAGARAYLLEEAALTPWVEAYGGRLFVGDGFSDAWLLGAGAGVLWDTGGAALSVGGFHERAWFDDGPAVATTYPHLGLQLSF